MKKRILVLIIVIILLVMAGITAYKYFIYDNSNKIDLSKLIITEVKNSKKDLIYDNELDKVTYSDKIINNDVTSVDYTFYDNAKSIVGKIYIGEDKKLYISNDNEYDVVKVSNLKFKTIYTLENTNSSGLHTYLITEDNKLYYFGLLTNNIRNVKLIEIETKYNVISFVNVRFQDDMVPADNKVFVLESDGNIYEINSGLRYKENIKSIFNAILAFEDNTVANLYGKMLEDKYGNYYKIKYMFLADANKKYIDYKSIILITEDNKMLSVLAEDDFDYVYEDVAKVKNIVFNKQMPFIEGELVIELDDDSKYTFNAFCSAYYCINDFIDNVD